MNELNGDRSAWLRCYRCWSQNLEIQIHYDAIRRVEPDTGFPTEGVDEVQEAVVQCLRCLHDQPHLTIQDDRVVPVEDRWAIVAYVRALQTSQHAPQSAVPAQQLNSLKQDLWRPLRSN